MQAKNSQKAYSHGWNPGSSESSTSAAPPREAATGGPYSERRLLETFDCTDSGFMARKTSTATLLVLTLPLAGLQAIFATLTAYGTPYLQALGVSKSATGLLWLSGPLFGTILQPCIGIWSDNCQIRWGKRKPFILVGGLGCVLSMAAFARADSIADWFSVKTGAPSSAPRGAGLVALLALYLLNASIQPLQSASRALLFDSTSWDYQSVAAALASMTTSFVNVLVYFLGNMDLPRYLPFLGSTQARAMASLAIASNVFAIAIACISVPDHSNMDRDTASSDGGLGDIIAGLIRAAYQLPSQVKRVMLVQTWSWLGWTPFLFYMSSHISELYVEQKSAEFAFSSIRTPAEIVTLQDLAAEGNRKASLGFLSFAISTTAWTALLPRRIRCLIKLQALSSKHPSQTTQIEAAFLGRLWLASHVLFTISMVGFIYVSSYNLSLGLMAVVGCPWAVTVWVPFALIGMALKTDDMDEGPWPWVSGEGSESSGLLRDVGGEVAGKKSMEVAVEQELRPRSMSVGRDRGGSVFGLQNVAIAAPQILGVALCSIVFGISDSHGGQGRSGPVFGISVAGGILAAAQIFWVGLWRIRRI